MTSKPPRWIPKVIEGGKQDISPAQNPSPDIPLRKEISETEIGEFAAKIEQPRTHYEMMKEGGSYSFVSRAFSEASGKLWHKRAARISSECSENTYPMDR